MCFDTGTDTRSNECAHNLTGGCSNSDANAHAHSGADDSADIYANAHTYSTAHNISDTDALHRRCAHVRPANNVLRTSAG